MHLKALDLSSKQPRVFYKRKIVSSGRDTRYSISSLLFEIAADVEIKPANIVKHFACELLGTPLVLHSASERQPVRSKLNIGLSRCRVSLSPVPFMLRWCTSSHRSIFVFHHICPTFPRNFPFLLTPAPHLDCLVSLSDEQILKNGERL